MSATTRGDRVAELSRWMYQLDDDELASVEGLKTLFERYGDSAPALVRHLSELVRSLAEMNAADPDFGGRIQRGLVRHGRKIWATTFLVAYLYGSHRSLDEALDEDLLATLQVAGSSLSRRVRGFLACTAEALRQGDLDAASAAMLAAYRERRVEVLSGLSPQLLVRLR